MYLDWYKNIKKMSQEEKGLLVDLMYASYNREDLPLIPDNFLVLDVMWDSIESIIRRNLRDYDNKLDSPTDSLKTVSRQTTDNKPTTDTETETATVKETDTGTVTEEEKKEVVYHLDNLERAKLWDKIINE